MLRTAWLDRRSLRPPDFEVENGALVALADELASSPETLLQSLVETAFELYRAESTESASSRRGRDVADSGGTPWPARSRRTSEKGYRATGAPAGRCWTGTPRF